MAEAGSFAGAERYYNYIECALLAIEDCPLLPLFWRQRKTTPGIEPGANTQTQHSINNNSNNNNNNNNNSNNSKPIIPVPEIPGYNIGRYLQPEIYLPPNHLDHKLRAPPGFAPPSATTEQASTQRMIDILGTIEIKLRSSSTGFTVANCPLAAKALIHHSLCIFGVEIQPPMQRREGGELETRRRQMRIRVRILEYFSSPNTLTPSTVVEQLELKEKTA
ncbi:hypothetical protein BGZ63DRAFT_407458 [Mariannaea sp. PMI_226]|nr:hypothetical protein BGZ63DRAFT_407458 [Mariannaea sp. PMI_226]